MLPGLQLLILWLNFPAVELIIYHGLLGLNLFLAILLMLLFEVNRRIFFLRMVLFILILLNRFFSTLLSINIVKGAK